MSEQDITNEWRNDKPPNETWVEVMDGDDVIEAMAVFGRDGYLPHWRLRNESQSFAKTFCHPSRFNMWREIPSQHSAIEDVMAEMPFNPKTKSYVLPASDSDLAELEKALNNLFMLIESESQLPSEQRLQAGGLKYDER